MARVLRPQGRRGEVSVELFTDFPELFAQRRLLSALAADGSRRELRLEDFWSPASSSRSPGSKRLVMKFAGVDSISQAEELAGCELQVTAEQRAPLAPGSAYLSDLAGCRVVATEGAGHNEVEVGAVTDVIFGAGEAPLLAITSAGRELLIPYASAYVRELDLAGRRLVMALPEGMLRLDAPLSKEEKADQHRGG